MKLKESAFVLNKHEIAEGHETLSEADERTPPSCVAVILTLPLLPCKTVALDGTDNEKSSCGVTFPELPGVEEPPEVFPFPGGGVVVFCEVEVLVDELLVEP